MNEPPRSDGWEKTKLNSLLEFVREVVVIFGWIYGVISDLGLLKNSAKHKKSKAKVKMIGKMPRNMIRYKLRSWFSKTLVKKKDWWKCRRLTIKSLWLNGDGNLLLTQRLLSILAGSPFYLSSQLLESWLPWLRAWLEPDHLAILFYVQDLSCSNSHYNMEIYSLN